MMRSKESDAGIPASEPAELPELPELADLPDFKVSWLVSDWRDDWLWRKASLPTYAGRLYVRGSRPMLTEGGKFQEQSVNKRSKAS
jgi:hypothetical protein